LPVALYYEYLPTPTVRKPIKKRDLLPKNTLWGTGKDENRTHQATRPEKATLLRL
jgi:hypothetical protein